jgi:putative membrane protein insertion efficiency factor
VIRGLVSAASWAVTAILVFLVRAYQVGLAPVLGGQCRYDPTCSSYAVEALERHGPVRGSLLAVRRIGRCHPFRAGGFDPVPAEQPAGGSDGS